jgi:hypothetical protein
VELLKWFVVIIIIVFVKADDFDMLKMLHVQEIDWVCVDI